MAERGLRIEIHGQHAVAVKRGRMGEMQCDGGLARAALEVGNRGTHRPLARRARRHQRPVLNLQLAPQLVDLFQRIPALAAFLFHLPLGQGRVGGQPAAQGRRVGLKDQLRHFPA